MVLSPTARGLVGNVLGGSGDDNDNSTQQLLEQQKLQNEQYKLQVEERRSELERLRKEKEKDEQKLKQNNEEIDRLRLIINDPNKSEEDKNRARSRMIVLEDENRKLKNKLGKLETDIKKIEDEKPTVPTTPSTP
jgi:chromosome segregation ATPase